jgi:hypothetical protein
VVWTYGGQLKLQVGKHDVTSAAYETVDRPKIGVVDRLRQAMISAFDAQAVATLKQLAILVGVVQAVACIASIVTLLMLHADGAYFVYVIGTGDPWGMKWREVAARITIYLFTVVPTQVMADLLQLSPIGIAKWNAFFFYGVQLLLYAISCMLIWTSQPRCLVFPVLQFALSTSLGFGFPSEILLSPGLLWICLFLIIKGRAASVAFLLSLLALLFTHELALPAALVCVYLAIRSIAAQKPDEPAMVLMHSLPILGAVVLLIGVRMIFGGVAADPNAFYIFDPRRILNNPTLWVLAPALTISSPPASLSNRQDSLF